MVFTTHTHNSYELVFSVWIKFILFLHRRTFRFWSSLGLQNILGLYHYRPRPIYIYIIYIYILLFQVDWDFSFWKVSLGSSRLHLNCCTKKIHYYLLFSILKCHLFLWRKDTFSAPLLQSSCDPSMILPKSFLICWFATVLFYFMENVICFPRIL